MNDYWISFTTPEGDVEMHLRAESKDAARSIAWMLSNGVHERDCAIVEVREWQSE